MGRRKRVFAVKSWVLPGLLLLSIATVASCGGGSRRPSRAEAQAQADAAREKERADAQAALETSRLAALWSYADVAAGRGRQVTAAIKSANNVDTAGSEPRPVLLVFRDHPSWGRSSYLLVEVGDFACGRCSVSVTVDDAAPIQMAAHKPLTDKATAIFIDDSTKLWSLTKGAKQLRVEFPAKGGGKRTADFETGGLDRSKMPGWD
jgi:hypothetical protein